MKILLIHPPKRYQVWAGVPSMFNDRFAYIFPPLAIMYLSSYLKKNTSHQVEVLDCIPDDLDFVHIAEVVSRSRPDVVGISVTATHNLVNVAKTIEAVRTVHPDAFIVIGGAHVNSFPVQAARLAGVDACIRGDGEQPIKILLETLETRGDLRKVPGIVLRESGGGVYQGDANPNEPDLNSLPFPDRDACPPGKYFTPGMKGAVATTIISSRGCPYRCVFCNVPRSYRACDAETVVSEMEECAGRHRVQDIHFVDDIFNITPDRVMKISEGVLRRALKIWWGYKASVRQTNREMIRLAKRAGCYRMHYGVETFTEEGLKALNKQVTLREIRDIFKITREENVKPIAYMIIGCPHEKTAGEIMGADRFLKELKPAYVVYSLFTPYPDASIFRVGTEKKLWEPDCWERFMLAPTEDYDLPTAWEEHLSKKDLVSVFKKLNRRFYFHPLTLLRTLLGLRSWAEVKRVFLGGVSLLRMELVRAASRKI